MIIEYEIQTLQNVTMNVTNNNVTIANLFLATKYRVLEINIIDSGMRRNRFGIQSTSVGHGAGSGLKIMSTTKIVPLNESACCIPMRQRVPFIND